MAAMRSKHVAKSFKCISIYSCVFYYIIVVSDVKYIHLKKSILMSINNISV